MNQTIRSFVSTSYKETLSSANIGFDAFDFLPYDPQIKHVERGEKVTDAFTTKELDEEAGLNLNYFGARYYDADVGLWTSVDAMRQFYSGYSYNPINGVDPDGNKIVFHKNASAKRAGEGIRNNHTGWFKLVKHSDQR